MNKKIIAAIMMGFALTFSAGADNPVLAAEAAVAAPASEYTYTSKDYGFSIICPQKPVGVIPVSALYPDKKGDVLVFDNEEFNIKYAWVIIPDGFEDKDVPDLNNTTPEKLFEYLQQLKDNNIYEGVALIDLNNNNKGVLCITAKEVEVDTDGDGQPDTTATADTQMAVTFFRGNKGTRYSVQLIDNPELRSSSVDALQYGLSTFVEN